MRRLLERLPRFGPSILVGLVVGAVVAFALGSLFIGTGVGLAVVIFLAWEETMHAKR